MLDRNVWKLSRSEQIVALIAIGASFVARGLAMLPAYAIDDYAYMVGGAQEPSAAVAIIQGRPLAALVASLLHRLDAAPPSSGLLSSLVLTLALVWVGITVCRMWRIREFPVLSSVVVLFVCLHPYQAEVFTFRIAVFTLAVALGLGFYGISTCHRSARAQGAAIFFVAAALLAYQVVFNYIAMAVLFAVAFDAAHVSAGRVEADTNPFGRVFQRRVLTLVSAAAAAAIAMLATPALFSVPLLERTSLLPFAEVGPRAVLALSQLRTMFALGEPIMPPLTKVLLVVTPTAAIAMTAARSPAILRKLSLNKCLPFIVAIGGGVPASLGIVLLLREWWPVPRVCAQVSLFWAGTFALAFLIVGPLQRRVMLALSAVVFFSFIGINNHIFQDQVRANLRDIAKANRIVARLEAIPGFHPSSPVAIIGGYWGYHSPLATVLGDMNVSALYVSWSKIPLLNEVSGYSFQGAPPAAVKLATDYCLSAPKWPSPGAVTGLESVLVVCLAN